jgi:hypothetical protein
VLVSLPAVVFCEGEIYQQAHAFVVGTTNITQDWRSVVDQAYNGQSSEKREDPLRKDLVLRGLTYQLTDQV